MKKILGCLAVVASLFLTSQAKALPVTIGKGLQNFELGQSTASLTPVLIATGAGVLQAVEISSAVTAGDNCAFFDSSTVAGYTTPNQAGTAAAPKIARAQATATNTMYNTPGLPTVFNNGVVAICNQQDVDVQGRANQ